MEGEGTGELSPTLTFLWLCQPRPPHLVLQQFLEGNLLGDPALAPVKGDFPAARLIRARGSRV